MSTATTRDRSDLRSVQARARRQLREVRQRAHPRSSIRRREITCAERALAAAEPDDYSAVRS